MGVVDLALDFDKESLILISVTEGLSLIFVRGSAKMRKAP